jgi:hypothetical protein
VPWNLRHCVATLTLTIDTKVISATLGHSRHRFTADVYTSAVPDVAAEAAEATVAITLRTLGHHDHEQDGPTVVSQRAKSPSPESRRRALACGGSNI